ncbi:titin homolog isoform X2 [Boleophthalmus pectinirostris]|nr:titin homolog isoform X2 [Boleophthalmus pectinirostris]
MSASKKKRMGSQRRSLNPNVQESPETSDTAKSPPLPQSRQRADAMTDLTLNPGSTESDPPMRKKKLGSQRGNKGKLHFKELDVTTESSDKPFEEVEGTTTHSQALDYLGIQNESIDESLERNPTEGSEAVDESSVATISALTEAILSVPQTSDILNINMETRSDSPLNDGQNKKIPKIASTQESVLTEMDFAQQMPDILEATLPTGVTGESTYPVRLIEQEDINITGSHDDNNKLNKAEDEAGHIEKPVCQPSDESSLPTAKIRKLGSSRRKKEVNLKELHDQGHELAVESNISNTLETTDLTAVLNTQEVTVDTSLDDAYREEEQPVMYASQNVKHIEEPKVEDLLVDFEDQEVKETRSNDDEKVVSPQDLSELSFIEISPTDDTITPQSSSHPDITVSVQDVEVAKILETGDSFTQQVFEETDESAESITVENSLTSGIRAEGNACSKENTGTFENDFFATEEEEKKEFVHQEVKDETLISSSLSSEIPSELEREMSSIAQLITEDETIQLGDPMFGAQMGIQSSTENLLPFDQHDNSDLLNVSVSPEPEDKNEMYAAQTENMDQRTSSSGSVADEDSSVDSTNNKDTFSDDKSINLTEEQLVKTSTDGVSTIPDQEEDIKLSDESQIVHEDKPLVSPNISLDDVCEGEGLLKAETTAAVVQEPNLKSSTYPNENINFGLLDEKNKEIDEKNFKEETIENSGILSKEMCSEESDMSIMSKDGVTEPTVEQPALHVTTEDLLHLDESKEFDVQNVNTRLENVTHKGVDDNSAGLAELGESTDKLLFSATHSAKNESEGANTAVILEQEPEPLMSSTLSTDPKEEDKEIELADKQFLNEPIYPSFLQKEEPQPEEPPSPDVSTEEHSEDNKLKQYVEVELLASPNKENVFVLIQDLPEVADGENHPTELNKSNDNVPIEISEDQMEKNETIVGLQKQDISDKDAVQIPHTDKINTSLASPHPDASVGEEDGTNEGSQLIGNRRKLGSSRRTKKQRQVNNESKETDVTPNERSAVTQVESVIEEQNQEFCIVEQATGQELDKSSVQVHDEASEPVEDIVITDKNLKSTKVTALFEDYFVKDIVKDNALKSENIQSNVTDSVLKVDSSFRQESPKEPQDTEENDLETGIYALKEPINVHQLTYLSDNETHEEIDTSLLQAEHPDQVETIGEPSEAVQLVNAPNTDPHHGRRRKLGSSQRMKARKPELTTANDEPVNESQDIDKVTEFVQSTATEDLPQKELNSLNFASEIEAELTNQSNAKPADKIFVLSDKEQTVDSEFSNQDKERNIQENKSVEVESSFTVDLNDKAEADSPHNADVLQDNTKGGSEEVITAKSEVLMQSAVTDAANIPKNQQEVQDMEFLKTTSEPKRRKMGSTRKSQLNRKQQDEEQSPEDNAAIFDITAAIHGEKSIAVVDEEDVSIATVSPVKDEQQNEDSAEMQMVAQESKKDEALPVEEAALIEVINKDATHNLQPITSEEIQPSSPGKRRKMGSTRKNLSTKKESSLEEIVTPINVEKEAVMNVSNENIESKEPSALLIHEASVHQQPPEEETPLSQQNKQLRPESELEVSPHPDVMTEDAAIARRRKMGSHRKPHTDQSIRQVKGTEESLHPLEGPRTESPKTGQTEERDNKAFSTASAFNIKGDTRPVGQKIPQQLPQPSMNVRRAQQSNIRLAAGYDLSVSKYEVIMIGDSSVGKTSFMQRAQSGKFSSDIPASIGMDSYKWTVVVDGKTVVLHLWDTAGQERFHSMTKQIFHRAQAFLLMYDITCAQTFTAVTYWANCIKEGAGENVVILLLGNKSDSKERKVRTVEGELLAQENDFAFLECSAATGENVIEALETVARLLSQKAARREEPLVLRKPEPRNKGCC